VQSGENYASRSSKKPATGNRRFKFQKSRQLFIRVRNKTLSVRRDVRPLESIAETTAIAVKMPLM
jgi:hypothetical protein